MTAASAATERAVRRICYIVADYPWPADSGVRQRQYQNLLGLSQCGDVDLLVLPWAPRPIPPPIASLCRRVFVQPRPDQSNASNVRARSRLGQLLCELGGDPLDQKKIASTPLLPEIREALKTPYDLVWIAKLRTALTLGHPGGPAAVLDLDDLEHCKVLRARAVYTSLFRKLRATVEARAWRRAELETLDRFGCVVVCSEDDRRYLNRPEKVAVVPNTVEVPDPVEFAPGVPGRMVFVGSMDYRPNDDAAWFFIRSILPRIRSRNSSAHVRIVGHNPSSALRELHNGRDVHVLGAVPDIGSCVAEAAISVVPLRIAGVTRLKILESLARKTPVVSTTVGNEGLDLEHRRHLLLADRPQAFADACLELLADESKRRDLAEAGHRQVAALYNRGLIAEHIANVVRKVENHVSTQR